MSRLLTIGTFDIPHAGHAIFLRRCEQFASEVIVGVNSDEFVERYKKRPPAMDWEQRAQLIRSLGYRVLLNDGPGRELIQTTWPNVIAIGTDWARKDYYAQIDTPIEYFEEHEISLLYIPYTKGISTTMLRGAFE